MSGKGGSAAGVLALLFVFAACAGGTSGPDTGSDAPSAPPSPTVGSVEPVTPVQASLPGVRVKRVIDGDTFELVDGSRVRVLGIDSCEMSTPQGPEAKRIAEGRLSGVDIVLTQEPGVDRDKYGRLLRYVQVWGTDFGVFMVTYDHTTVYAGKNDANPAYVARLRSMDGTGRNCAGTPPVSNNYVPVPNGDGDDGGENRFCRRHWYC